MSKYQVEIKWNREFEFVPHGAPYEDLDMAIGYAEWCAEMGDGARIKDKRVVDQDGVVHYAYGTKIKEEPYRSPQDIR